MKPNITLRLSAISYSWLNLLLLVALLVKCSEPPVTKPGFNFDHVHTIAIAPIKDFDQFPGSGEIITRSLSHYLLKLGLNIVEREDLKSLVQEASLSQSAMTEEYDLSLGVPDAIILCTITEFSNSRTIVVPVKIHDKGHTVTTVEEKSKPVVINNTKDEDASLEITYETTTTEETTQFAGTITETSRVEYVNSVVGVSLQMIDKKTGEILWSSNYWYDALKLSHAVDRCIAGAVKPLGKLLE